MRAPAAFLAAACLLVAACDRGCLRLHDEPSPEPGPKGASTAASRGGGWDLAGTDCSDGLLRCAEGRIEASRAGHVPHPCTGGACECPWEEIGRCPLGCVVEDLEVIGGPDAGTQLCRPEAPIARPFDARDEARAGPADVCSEEGVRCDDGVVVACDESGRPERRIAVCSYGCELGVSIAHGSSDTSRGAPEILCARVTAERR